MSNLPIAFAAGNTTLGTVAASSRGTDLGTGYTELIASTAEDYEGFYPSFSNSGVAEKLVSIAIGAAAAEQDLITDVYISSVKAVAQISFPPYLPLRIPKGSRVSAKSTTIANLSVLGITGGAGQPQGFAGCDTYGISGGGGTAIDPGASANTKGSWVEIIASTTDECQGILMQAGRNNNATLTSAHFLFDIGIGAGGSEIVLIADISAEASTLGDNLSPTTMGIFPSNIPAGTRLAVRSQSSTTDATDRIMDVALYCFR